MTATIAAGLTLCDAMYNSTAGITYKSSFNLALKADVIHSTAWDCSSIEWDIIHSTAWDCSSIEWDIIHSTAWD